MPPIVIAAAIAGGAALYGAHKTASAADKAAKGQQDAARQAQGFNERVYGEQKQLLNPFVQMGTNAMQRYGAYTAQPFNERIANVGQPFSPGTARSPFAFGSPPQAPAAPMGGTATGGGGGGGFGFGGGRVRIQSPDDGSVRMVPPELVDRLVAKGGRVVQ